MSLEARFKSRAKSGMDELTIGEVARRAGVAASSIRYYERIGLLPQPDRLSGQRRYDAAVLGRLGFIAVAQSAGFKLREIKALIHGVDGANGMGEQMRLLSTKKLNEVEALLERTKAMKGWLEVAKDCGCASPAECALFPAPGEEAPDGDLALQVIRVAGQACRRAPAGSGRGA
jgi:MerR family transcriptional regulator, redox-sensitive transcriptional activator SoxR